MSKTVEQKVRAEQQRFELARAELWKVYPNKHVVFLGGEVKGIYDTPIQAYLEALSKFGSEGGFVISKVTEKPEFVHIYPMS